LILNPEQLLGKLTSGLAKEGFDTTTLTTFSWQLEIAQLQASVEMALGPLDAFRIKRQASRGSL
jgi:hypothetical protein